MDELVPNWVKKEYSPRESWKDKPFGKEDARFFFKGIDELSELFTEERSARLPNYFSHPKYRSAYLLYFLPLQAAKFLTLFDLHPQAIAAALESGRKNGVLRVADLGAGPGTASLALLLWILGLPGKDAEDLPPIELLWWDTSGSILKEGRELVLGLAERFPRLRGKVSVQLHEEPWWKAPASLKAPTDLVIMGHVLNEAREPQNASEAWPRIMERAHGGGILIVEPALRRASQQLSQLRDGLIEEEVIDPKASSIWGPCLHAGRCPLAQGRDWCHFSVPTEIPGKWFREFSRGLGSERQWLKFSYLWIASRDYPSIPAAPELRRVISDPLDRDRGPGKGRSFGPQTFLLCEPERPARVQLPANRRVRRGDLIRNP